MKQYWIGVSAVLLFAGALFAEEDKSKEEKPDAKPDAPKVTLSGVFEAKRMTEVEFEVEQVATAKVKKLAPHGTHIGKGDFLISFERESYDEQLKSAERKFASTELSMKESEFALEQFRETQKLDRAAAERTWKSAQDSYDGYLEFDRQYAIDSTKFSLQQSRNSLEYAEEDLRQLERMYKEDELTEESEELVLTRARRAVEASKFYLRNTEVRTERTLTQRLPREQESRKDAHERAKMVYEKAKRGLEIASKKKKLEMDTARDAYEKEKKKLDELRDDGEKLIISSPANGILFYGPMVKGQMNDKAAGMKQGTSVSKGQVIATIVNPKRLQIHTTVSEKDIAKLKVGMSGTAKPTAFEDRSLNVEIASLGATPYAKGKYDCVLSIDGKISGLLPTMTCTVTFDLPPTEKKSAEKKKSKDKARKKEKGERAKDKDKDKDKDDRNGEHHDDDDEKGEE